MWYPLTDGSYRPRRNGKQGLTAFWVKKDDGQYITLNVGGSSGRLWR
jgi:hypothetical protein